MQGNHKVFWVLAALAALFCLKPGIVYAAASYDDGFGAARKTASSHFVIYYAPQVEPDMLAQQLNIGSSDSFLAGRSNAGTGLTDMVDTLFARVCDMLDMQLYSFQGNIKVCQTGSQLSQVYDNLFGHDLGGRKSFYVFELNTIYISADGFSREILGHEMAHAIMCHYFVVLPSIKVQEVLAMYVEYQLRKVSQ